MPMVISRSPDWAVGVRELGHQTPPPQEVAIWKQSARFGSSEFVSAIVAHPASGENVGVGQIDVGGALIPRMHSRPVEVP